MCFPNLRTQQTQTAFRRQCLSESVWRVSSKYCRQALSSKLFCLTLSAVFVRVFVILLMEKDAKKLCVYLALSMAKRLNMSNSYKRRAGT